MTNKDNSVEEEIEKILEPIVDDLKSWIDGELSGTSFYEQDDIDKELYAFFYSATDEQELVHDIQRSVDKAKQAITDLLHQSEIKGRINEIELYMARPVKYMDEDDFYLSDRLEELNQMKGKS